MTMAPIVEHVYVSTYCQHGHCANCRHTCKLCQAPCHHSCHRPERIRRDQPGRQP